jgi:hypothetical protein
MLKGTYSARAGHCTGFQTAPVPVSALISVIVYGVFGVMISVTGMGQRCKVKCSTECGSVARGQHDVKYKSGECNEESTWIAQSR